VLVVVDQAIKALVRATLALGESRSPFPGLTVRRIDNNGIAFGLFPGRNTLIAVITLLALCAIGVILAEVGRRHAAVPIGGGLLIGGSIGNVIDRISRGAVTDFVKMPALDNYFNVADAGITGGALLIAYGLWRTDVGRAADS
jgi:signal peptidase II